MNATLAGLLQACAETTHDGTPHLILADWMDDHGQPERAELIRVQCRLADWVPDWQERLALIARQDELIARHREAWLGPLNMWGRRVEFVRGLARVELTTGEFCKADWGTAFLAQADCALIEQVTIHRGRGFTRLATRPWLEWIPALSLAGLGLRAEELAPLLDAPLLHRLVALDLSYNDLGWAAVGLSETPLAGNLARLGLRNNGLTPREWKRIMEQEWPRLRDLDLGCNDLLTDLIADVAARYPARRPGRVNSLGMEFARIPAGSFRMGASEGERNPQPDESPQHTVTLTQPFYLGRFAVTQCEYLHVMKESPSHFSGSWLPVDRVGPEEALDFCARLGRLPAELAAGRSYRLPTEAEWEHACRAGTTTQFHFGDEPTLDRMSFQGRWEAYDMAVPHPETTAVVGSYPPNAFGLHEMHGNVWECCSDWYDNHAYTTSPRVDPTGPREGTYQVRRGGCFEAIGSFCRAAKRHGAGPQRGGTRHHGFRIVLIPPPEAA